MNNMSHITPGREVTQGGFIVPTPLVSNPFGDYRKTSKFYKIEENYFRGKHGIIRCTDSVVVATDFGSAFLAAYRT